MPIPGRRDCMLSGHQWLYCKHTILSPTRNWHGHWNAARTLWQCWRRRSNNQYPEGTTTCVLPRRRQNLCTSQKAPQYVYFPEGTTPCILPRRHHNMCTSQKAPHRHHVYFPEGTTPCVLPRRHHNMCTSHCRSDPDRSRLPAIVLLHPWGSADGHVTGTRYAQATSGMSLITTTSHLRPLWA